MNALLVLAVFGLLMTFVVWCLYQAASVDFQDWREPASPSWNSIPQLDLGPLEDLGKHYDPISGHTCSGKYREVVESRRELERGLEQCWQCTVCTGLLWKLKPKTERKILSYD